MKWLSVLLGMLLFSSCFYKKKQGVLEQALQFAGENRVELEKVLNYYEIISQGQLEIQGSSFLN